MLWVVEYNILVKACWLESKVNKLADTLSYFNQEIIAELYLYWQNLLTLILYNNPGYCLSVDNIYKEPYYERASLLN